MKKSLLVLAALAGCSSVFAEVKVDTIGEFYSMNISPNGDYIASYTDNKMQVLNVRTNKIETYETVSPGNGNCVANNGVVVGSNEMDAAAIIWDNKLVFPENLTKFSLCDLHGITPNATRICGLVNAPEDNTDGQMYQPMILDVKEDGSVSDPILLPHPEKDFFGTTPQYCSAVWISADGKSVFGQVLDESGMFISPIVYKEGADGKWSYTLPTEAYFNPNKIVIPENPGEFEEEAPQYTDYMSEEKKAEYEAAYKAWQESNYQSDLYPEPANYMTPEQIEAYNKATDEYNAKVEAYNEKFMAYRTALDEVINDSLNFLQTGYAVNGAGTILAAASVKTVLPEGAEWPEEVYQTYVFDLEKNTLTPIECKKTDLVPSQVLANGEVLASTPAMGIIPPTTYILTPGAADYVPVQDFLEGVCPEAVTWLNENLLVDLPTSADEEGNLVYEKVLMTGHAVASDDMSVISGGVFAFAFDESLMYMSYVITGSTNSVENVATEGSALRALKGGVLEAKGVVADVEVYTVAGAHVYSAASLQGTVNTGLASGVYAISWTDAAGERHTSKVLF